MILLSRYLMMIKMKWYIGNSTNRFVLKHHGIKGQQWGVRNGPPYPIEDKVLRKGTTLATVQGKYSNANAIKGTIKKNKMLYTYNPNDKNDSDIYEGVFSYTLKNNRHAKRIEKTMYTAIKDLKMPTRKERVDEFKKLYKSEKWGPDMRKQLPELVGYLNQGGLLKQVMNGKVPNKISADPKSKNEWDALYIAFNFARKHPEKQKYTKQYIKNMMEKYDAMVDDNNVNIYNDAHDPVIVFKYRSSLQKVGSVKLSDEHITEAFKRVEKKMEKAGKTVLL